MRAILTIVLNDLRIFFSHRGNLIGLLVMPILFTLVLGWSLGGGGGGPSRLRVDLMDLDNTDLSARLIDELHATNDALVLCPLDNDSDDYCRLEDEPFDLARAIERARQGRTSALIVVPAGYAAALQTFQRATIDYYSISDPTIPSPVLQTLNAVLQRVNSASMTTGVAGALLDNFMDATGFNIGSEASRNAFINTLYLGAEQKLREHPLSVRYVTTDEKRQCRL